MWSQLWENITKKQEENTPRLNFGERGRTAACSAGIWVETGGSTGCRAQRLNPCSAQCGICGLMERGSHTWGSPRRGRCSSNLSHFCLISWFWGECWIWGPNLAVLRAYYLLFARGITPGAVQEWPYMVPGNLARLRCNNHLLYCLPRLWPLAFMHFSIF